MLLAMMDLATLEKIAIFLVVLSILIVLHEYGHFVLARFYRVRVIEFAVGFGPKIFGLRSARSGTMYSLRALPLGGFCQMQGEDNKTSEAVQQRDFAQSRDNEPDADDNFQSKGAWKRLVIVAAGPSVNLVLALVILLIAALAFGVQSNRYQPLVGPLAAGMPAQKAGLRVGDRIDAIDGVPIRGGDKLVALIHQSLGKRLHITYTRNGVAASANVTPVLCPQPPPNPKHYGCIGFSPVPQYERVGFNRAVSIAGDEFRYIAQGTIGGLALLISHPQQYAPHLSGVVGMGQAAITIEDFGWGPYLFFAAVISFALGVMNFLPIPALDGGRLAFIIAELVRGKPVDPEKEALVHITGFGILIVLMIVINVYNAALIVQGKGPF